ncbi:MAG: hypothetical protein WAN48_07295 [Actinomycetes bacterium]
MAAFEQALVAEAVRKGDLGWIDVAGASHSQAVWLAWHDDAIHLVTGGDEQRDPGLVDGATATVIVRSKDKWVRLVAAEVSVRRVDPGTAGWDSAAQALSAKRLNSVDGDATVDRWSRSSSIWRLVLTGSVFETPDAMGSDSHRATPPPTTATTKSPLPLVIGPRGRRRRL